MLAEPHPDERRRPGTSRGATSAVRRCGQVTNCASGRIRDRKSGIRFPIGERGTVVYPHDTSQTGDSSETNRLLERAASGDGASWGRC